MDQFFQNLVFTLPKLRNQFGFIGLVVTIGGFVITRQLAPESLPAQLAVGSVGVTLIVFGQVFYFLRLIPAAQRRTLIIVLFLTFCIFMVTQLFIATIFITKNRERLPDGESLGIPAGWTFKMAVQKIAEEANMTVDFSSCPDSLLKAPVTPGPIQAQTNAALIELLALRVDLGHAKYEVIPLKERGIYEIRC